MNEHFDKLYQVLDSIIENSTKQIESSSLTVEMKQEGKQLVKDLQTAVSRMKLNLNNLTSGGMVVGDMHHTDGEVLRKSRERLEQWLIAHCSSGLE
jgi:hypothetical protein